MIRLHLAAAIAVCGLGISLPAVYAEPLAERISSGQPVRQGIANDAPFGYVDQGGTTVGIEVELAKAILGKLGAKSVEQVGTTFGALIPGVQANRFDMASNGMYVRPERCRAVDFARPHLMVGVGAFVRKGSEVAAQDIAGLAKIPGLRVGILTGGGEGKIFVAAGGSQDQILDFADRAGLAAGLTSDRIDVAFLTSIGAAATVANNGELSLLTPFRPLVVDGKPQVSYASFAFSKNDPEFVEAFNRELTAFISSPAYPELLAKYGVPADVLPKMDVSIEELCG